MVLEAKQLLDLVMTKSYLIMTIDDINTASKIVKIGHFM